MTTRTNLIANPSLEIDSSNWAGGSRTTATAHTGSAALQSNEGAIANFGVTPVAITAGLSYTASGYVKAGGTSDTGSIRIRWYNGSTQVGASPEPESTITALGWTRLSVTATAPANANGARVDFYAYSSAGATGDFAYVDGAMLEQASTLGAYFDGATPDGSGWTYEWTGSPHASTSTATYVPPPAPTPPMAIIDVVRVEYETEPNTWLNLSGPTRNVRISRQDGDVGLASIEVLDAELDPTQVTTLRPGERVRVRALDGMTWKALYTGTVDNLNVSYHQLPGGQKVSITMSASDNVARIANAAEPRVVTSVEALRPLVWGKFPAMINGSTANGPGTAMLENPDQSLWQSILTTRDSTLAYAWVDAENVLQVWDGALLSNTPVAALGPNEYATIEVDFNTEDLINSVTLELLQPVSGDSEQPEVLTAGPYRDEDSIAQWGERHAVYRVALPDPINAVDFTEALLASTAVAEMRARSISVPITTTAAVSRAVLDLNDPTTITLTDGVSTATGRITGIEHDITADTWRVTYGYRQAGFGSPSGGAAAPGAIPPGSVGESALDPDIVANIQNALEAADAANEFASSKNAVYRQPAMPSGGTFELGDIWFDTNDGNRIYVHDGTTFVDARTSYVMTPNGKVSLTPSGLYGFDAVGNVTFYLDSGTGNVTMKGALTAGSTVSGAVVTGGTVQTTSTANRGIKVSSTGMSAYSAVGSPTFVINANTGEVTMLGNLTSGSTITGSTVTGSTLQVGTPGSTSRLLVRDDGASGVIEAWSAAGTEANAGKIDPYYVTNGGGQYGWRIQTGTPHSGWAGYERPNLTMASESESGAVDAFATLSATLLNLRASTLTLDAIDTNVTGRLTSSGDVTTTGGSLVANNIRPQSGSQVGFGTDTFVNMPGTVKAGLRTVTVNASNSNVTATVSFPAAFPSSGPVPQVFLTAVGLTGNTTLKLSPSSITRSGFTINAVRSSGTGNIDVQWLAICS